MISPDTFKVVPKEAARNKEQPHLVVLPAIVEHPVRAGADKQKIGNLGVTGDGVVPQVQVGSHGQQCEHGNRNEDENPPSHTHGNRSVLSQMLTSNCAFRG